MLATFSKSVSYPCVLVHNAVKAADVEYNGNLVLSITWTKGRRVRFTVNTKDGRAYGSRKSVSGRFMPHASWEAYRDVLIELFNLDPGATVITSMATYRGKEGFEANYPATAYKNIGSQMQPAYMPDLSVPIGGCPKPVAKPRVKRPERDPMVNKMVAAYKREQKKEIALGN